MKAPQPREPHGSLTVVAALRRLCRSLTAVGAPWKLNGHNSFMRVQQPWELYGSLTITTVLQKLHGSLTIAGTL